MPTMASIGYGHPSAGSFLGLCTHGYECATVLCACLAYVCQIQTPHATVTGYLNVMMLVDMIVGLSSKGLSARGAHTAMTMH